MDKVNSKEGTHTLKVPGASLYYELRGSGPVLLFMPGGPADAGGVQHHDDIRDVVVHMV